MNRLRFLWLRLTRRLPDLNGAWFRKQADQAERERLEMREDMMRQGVPTWSAARGAPPVTGDEVLKGIHACERFFRRVADLMERDGLDPQSAMTRALAEEP